VIVFVHGIFSNGRTCWLAQENGRSVYWPDLVRVDPRLQTPSIYIAGYYTSVEAGAFPLDQCARQVLEALERPDVFGRPRVLDKKNIVFVCHSTGGIVVRYLLLRYGKALAGKAIGLALIASPSRGSVWANVAAIAARYYNQRLGQQLRWGGDDIEEIHSRFKDLVNARESEMPGLFGMEACETRMVFRKNLPGFLRVVLPPRLKLVSTESAGQYFGQVKYLPDTDHFSSVKPNALTHPSHEFLETFLRRFRSFVDRTPVNYSSPVPSTSVQNRSSSSSSLSSRFRTGPAASARQSDALTMPPVARACDLPVCPPEGRWLIEVCGPIKPSGSSAARRSAAKVSLRSAATSGPVLADAPRPAEEEISRPRISTIRVLPGNHSPRRTLKPAHTAIERQRLTGLMAGERQAANLASRRRASGVFALFYVTRSRARLYM
jgi:pimeloyl-ACP methyl ester carboxylesterase